MWPDSHTVPVQLDMLMQPRHGILVDVLCRLPHPNVRTAHKDIKHALQRLILLSLRRRLVIERVVRREYRRIAQRSQDQFALALVRRLSQSLQSRPHMRIRLARDTHHFPVQPFRIYIRDRRDLVRRLFIRLPGALGLGLRKRAGVVLAPSLLVAQVGFEESEEIAVEENLAAFEFLPGAVGAGSGDGEVDPAEGYVSTLFVVEDGLEGRDDLHAQPSEVLVLIMSCF